MSKRMETFKEPILLQNREIFYKEATRSRHSSFAFIPYIPRIPRVLKRIVKNRDKGKRF